MAWLTNADYDFFSCCVNLFAVYHVTQDGWTKVRGDDVSELHYQYYPRPELHPSNATEVLAV